MCSPPMAAIAMGGAQGANFLQGRQAARAQNKFGKQQYEFNKKEALQAMVQSFQGGQTRINQERVSTSQALKELSRQAAEARGTIKAGATTVTGKSVDALLGDYERQELIRAEVLETNLKNTETEIVQGFDVIRSNTESRIRSGIPQPVQTPSFLNAAIQIGSSALSTYMAAGGEFGGSSAPSTDSSSYYGKY